MKEMEGLMSKIAEDARHSAELSFWKAVETIDKEFGEGYSEKHPELVGKFIQASSAEIAGTTIAGAILELSEIIKETSNKAALENIALKIEDVALNM